MLEKQAKRIVTTNIFSTAFTFKYKPFTRFFNENDY